MELTLELPCWSITLNNRKSTSGTSIEGSLQESSKLRQARSIFSAALLCMSMLAACGKLDYNEISPNSVIDGRLFVMWVGEGSPSSGDGQFVFVPNPIDPLKLTRFDANGEQVETAIQPEMMYTDGGSIPRLATVFNGFSPWGYAPAYMIHDWLFIANHCVRDDMATQEQRKIEGMQFQTSAVIIAEAIKALQVSGQVANNDVAAATISSAVAGPISRSLWETDGACLGHQVSDEHRQAVLRAFPEEVRDDLARQGIDVVETPLDSPLTPAVLIGEFGFR